MGNKATRPQEINSSTAAPAEEHQVTTVSSLGNLLFDYVVTSIDVIETGDVEGNTYGEGAKYVEFDGKIEAKEDDTDVAYLIKVKETETSTLKHVRFQAISVTKEFFTEKIAAENKKILACIHGFTVEPESWMDQCATIDISEEFEHLVLPVIWPSIGRNIFRYDAEQTIAFQAGKAFETIADIGQVTSLSVMSHSMGNRVLFSYAKAATVEKRFDSIFMVAADVWEEVFNKRVVSDTWFQPPWNYWNLWEDSGLKLCQMMKDGGKIHIINYPGDRALMASHYGENWRSRLGRYGKAAQEGRIDERCEPTLVGLDLKDYGDEVKEVDSAVRHSYHLMPRLLRYYNSAMKN